MEEERERRKKKEGRRTNKTKIQKQQEISKVTRDIQKGEKKKQARTTRKD